MPKQIHERSILLRSAVSSDDAAINLTTAAGALARASNAKTLTSGLTYAEIFFFGTGVDGDAGTNVSLYGWFDDSTPTTYLLGKWSVILGTQIATTLPDGDALASGVYFDTITADNDYWGVTIRDSGNNHIARLALDLRGLRYIYAEMENVGGGGTEADSIGAFYRGY